MKHPSVTVILPTYNEAENIAALITAIQKQTPKTTDILVVDDNSPDGTAGQVKANARVRLTLRTANRGLTNSLRDGIIAAKSDIVVWMDCDFSHPPIVIPKLLESIANGADIALAARTQYPGLSWIINRVCMICFGGDISDYTTGFLAIRKTVLDRIPLAGDYGEYCIDLLVRAQQANYHIVEIPFSSPPRRSGDSKTAPDTITLLRHGSGYLSTLLRLLWSHKLFRRINHT